MGIGRKAYASGLALVVGIGCGNADPGQDGAPTSGTGGAASSTSATTATGTTATGSATTTAGTGGSSGTTTTGSATTTTGIGGSSGATTGTGGGTGGSSGTPRAGSGIFPPTSPWYQDISGAALDARSKDVIDGLAMAGGWGNANRMQIDFSIEVLLAEPTVARRPFVTTADFYNPDCDKVDVPVPTGGRLEGENDYACAGDGDCHLLVVQGTSLYEMWRADISGGTAAGTFRGGCLAVWDLTKDNWTPKPPPSFARGDQCSSADAAGYPITPLLFSADEVAAGEIKHAIRFILPNDRIDPAIYLHPATHATRHTATAATPVPYGARLRLKSSFDLGKLPNERARIVARALQRYGMFLADGGNIALTAQSDTYTQAKWSGLLGARDLAALTVPDFEMVDGGSRIPLTLDCTRQPVKQ